MFGFGKKVKELELQLEEADIQVMSVERTNEKLHHELALTKAILKEVVESREILRADHDDARHALDDALDGRMRAREDKEKLQAHVVNLVARVDDLIMERHRLKCLLDSPVKFEKCLSENGVQTQHWAVKHMVHSFEKTLAGCPQAIAIEIGQPNTKQWYEVVVRRAKGPTIVDRLEERKNVIQQLLSIIDRHVCHIEGSRKNQSMFELVFGVDDRVALKRAMEIVDLQDDYEKAQKEAS